MSTNQSSPSEDAGNDRCWGQIAGTGALTPEVFEPYVGDIFRVTYQRFETEETHTRPLNVGDGSAEPEVIVELKLVEVTRYPRLKEHEGGFEHRPREPFSLLLEGPDHPHLMDAQHTVDHDQLGRGRLFFGSVRVTLKHPDDRQDGGRFYEVTFN